MHSCILQLCRAIKLPVWNWSKDRRNLFGCWTVFCFVTTCNNCLWRTFVTVHLYCCDIISLLMHGYDTEIWYWRQEKGLLCDSLRNFVILLAVWDSITKKALYNWDDFWFFFTLLSNKHLYSFDGQILDAMTRPTGKIRPSLSSPAISVTLCLYTKSSSAVKVLGDKCCYSRTVEWRLLYMALKPCIAQCAQN